MPVLVVVVVVAVLVVVVVVVGMFGAGADAVGDFSQTSKLHLEYRTPCY